MAFVWSDGFTVNLDRTTMLVKYYDVNNKYVTEKRFSPLGLINGCQFNFEQSYNPAYRSISNGKAFVVMDNRENKNYIKVVGAYFHNSWGFVPSISISPTGGGIGFSPSAKTDKLAEDYVLMEN